MCRRVSGAGSGSGSGSGAANAAVNVAALTSAPMPGSLTPLSIPLSIAAASNSTVRFSLSLSIYRQLRTLICFFRHRCNDQSTDRTQPDGIAADAASAVDVSRAVPTATARTRTRAVTLRSRFRLLSVMFRDVHVHDDSVRQTSLALRSIVHSCSSCAKSFARA